MKNPNFAAMRFAVAVVAITILTLAMAAVPILAQNAVPPTARQAAASPAFAQRLAHPSRRPPAPRTRRRASPQDGVIYSNGPVNGTVDAWTVNFGYVVSNSFTLASGSGFGGFDFYVWAYPGDTPLSVDWSITSAPFGGTTYGSGTAQVTSTFLSSNQYGYDIDLETVTGLNVGLDAGTYFLNLQNAVTSFGDPLFWDENSGPSQAYSSGVGTIASEAFDVTGGARCDADRPVLPRSVQTQAYSVTSPMAQAHNYKVLHDFTGGADGGAPQAGLTIDAAGNLYGTASFGGHRWSC